MAVGSLLTFRQQIALALGVEGTFSTGVFSAANASTQVLAESLTLTPEQERFAVDFHRGTRGSVPGTRGPRLFNVGFAVPMHGTGVAGTAPVWFRALRACGFVQTVNSGTAAIGAVAKNPARSTANSVVPTLAGTYSGTKSGRLVLTIVDVTANTSIVVRATFYPSDGTAVLTDEFVQDSGTAVTLTGVAAGVTFDYGTPSSSTANMNIGDEVTAALTGTSEVSVVLRPGDLNGADGGSLSAGEFPCLNMGVYTDGRRHGLHSSRGSFVMTAERAGAPVRCAFEMKAIESATGAEAFSDSPLLTDVPWDNVVPSPFRPAVVTWNGLSVPCIDGFTFTLGNTVVASRCAQEAQGYEAIRITGHPAATLALAPLAALFATRNWFDIQNGPTIAPLVLSWGSTPGNKFTLTFPHAELNIVGRGNREGEITDDLTFLINSPRFDGDGNYHFMELKLE